MYIEIHNQAHCVMADGETEERLQPGPGPAPDESGQSSVPAPETAGREKEKKKKKKNKVGSSRGVETMFRTSYRVHMDLSSLADAKANIMISINGIIMSIIIASISTKIDANPWLLVPTTVMLLTCLVSILYAVRAARPRVSSSVVSLEDVRRERANILFFGHFVNMRERDFEEAMMELIEDADVLYPLMIRDIYGLGSVLQRKFSLLRVSYTAFMIGLVLSIALYLGVYVWIVITMPEVTSPADLPGFAS